MTGTTDEHPDPIAARIGLDGTSIIDTIRARQCTTQRLDEPMTIPLMFVVNRCDPHALAEVTKRYGLALAVSADGAEPVDVAVAVGGLVADLETIVEQCTALSAGE